MEIGQKIEWIVFNKKNEGIFMKMINKNIAEVMCISMNGIKCAIKVKIQFDLIRISK
jgi:hypothetical protein